MPDGNLIVADTSPLLNLALIDRLDLLSDQFETTHAPEQVWDELTAGDEGLPKLRALRDSNLLEVVAVDPTDLFIGHCLVTAV